MRLGYESGGQHYWEVIKMVAEKLSEEVEISFRERKSNFDKNHVFNNSLGTNNKAIQEIRLAFHSFPDTGLPYYFRYGLSNGMNITFRKIKGWDSSINLFERNEADVHLHSFSQALVLEKSLKRDFIFIPLFQFDGYGLVIKKNKEIQSMDFFHRGRSWKNYLLNQDYKIVLEKHSDFHWMFNKHVQKISGVSEKKSEQWNKIQNNIINHDTDQGKKQFLRNKEAMLYSTNWVHFESLIRKRPDDFLVLKNSDYYNHSNLNGFILLKDYYENNKALIARLLHNWYDSLSILDKEFKEEKKHGTSLFIQNSHIRGYCMYLKEQFSLDISPSELQDKFSTYNEFYTDLNKSLNHFKIVTNNIKNYESLADLNNIKINSNNLDISEDDIQKLIQRSIGIIKEL